MPELARFRQEEFNNLRPLILAICFIWGVGMGFALNFFRPPEGSGNNQGQNQTASGPASAENAARPLTELERRHAGTPTIAPIEPAPAPVASARLSFEDTLIEPPAVVLTTDGGLTGRNAAKPNANRGAAAAAPAAPVYQNFPLIPDLEP